MEGFQIIICRSSGLQDLVLMSTDPYDYFFVSEKKFKNDPLFTRFSYFIYLFFFFQFSQGKVKVDSIDDGEELEFTDIAFDTLGFSLEEKQNAFRLTASIAHLGEMTFKQIYLIY